MNPNPLSRPLLIGSLALLGVVAPAQAQDGGGSDFATRCKHWIEQKGYSTDYIEQRTGKRQKGLAPRWKGNLPVDQVEVGDVVFIQFINTLGAPGERVAYVEEVEKDADGKPGAVFVTEWNVGKRYTDKECNVTDLFGRTAGKPRVPIATVVRVWRPSLPLP